VSGTMCCYLDRRRTLTRRSPIVYRVWTLTGIWFLSAAAARTSTVVLTSSTYRSTEFLSTHLDWYRRDPDFGTRPSTDLRFEYGNRRNRCL